MTTSGRKSELGDGVVQSDAEAVRCYEQAAELGSIHAQHTLGIFHEAGRSVKQSHEMAAHWYRRAADRGHAASQVPVGQIVPVRQGRAGGHRGGGAAVPARGRSGPRRDSMIEMAALLHGGTGVAKNQEAAVSLLQRAARQRHSQAEYNLGVCFKTGAGVDQSYVSAAHWFRLAATQGHAQAQLEYGLLCSNGQGLVKSDEAAARWLRLAADDTASRRASTCWASSMRPGAG